MPSPRIPIASVAEGRGKRGEARDLRDAGGVVSEEWAEWIEAQLAARAERTGKPVQLRATAPYVDDAGAAWFAAKAAIAEVGDPTRSGLMRGNDTIRPTTLNKPYASFVSAHLQSPARLGGRRYRTTDLSAAVVQAWVNGRLADGHARSSISSDLVKLRSLVGEMERHFQAAAFPWRGVRIPAAASPRRRGPGRPGRPLVTPGRAR